MPPNHHFEHTVIFFTELLAGTGKARPVNPTLPGSFRFPPGTQRELENEMRWTMRNSSITIPGLASCNHPLHSKQGVVDLTSCLRIQEETHYATRHSTPRPPNQCPSSETNQENIAIANGSGPAWAWPLFCSSVPVQNGERY